MTDKISESTTPKYSKSDLHGFLHLLEQHNDLLKIDKQVIKGGGSFIDEKPLFDTGILGPSSYGENVHEFKHLYNAKPK